MSGISGRHASHAKRGKLSDAASVVKTAAAVTGVLAVSGGVATAIHLHQVGLRDSPQASAESGSSASDAAAADALAARGAQPAADRGAQRPALPSGSADGTGTGAGTAHPTPAPTMPTSALGPTAATRFGTAPVGTPKPVTTATVKPVTTTTGTKTTANVGMGYSATPAQAEAIARQIVPSGQFQCFANIIERESSWNVHATNAYSGAYGLGQALPGYKMASAGSDWRNSATVQIRWALAYMTSRYGSPCAAWTFWQNHHWY